MHVVYYDTPCPKLADAVGTLGKGAFVAIHEGLIMLSVDKALVVEFFDHFRCCALVFNGTFMN